MKKFAPSFFLIIILLSLSPGCEKIRQLPPEPAVEFRQFIMYDTIDMLGNPAKAGRLEFYFEDGDGDIGLTQSGEEQSDTTNLFFTLLKKEENDFKEVDESDPNKPSAYRIPYIEREGQNKVVQGTVEITFLYFFYKLNDTIRYDFYIKDRAGNESNIASSCEIPFSLQGPCIIE